MMKMLKATSITLILVAISSAVLSGCGKKSPLSLPDSSHAISQNSGLSLQEATP